MDDDRLLDAEPLNQWQTLDALVEHLRKQGELQLASERAPPTADAARISALREPRPRL